MITFLSADLFGMKHISGLLVVILLVILALYLVEKYKPKTFFVLVTVTLIFFVLELLKQIESGFPMNHLPFHLCSFPLYLYPIITFVKNDKVKQFVLPAAYATVLFGGLIALLYPSNILGSENTWALVHANYLPYIAFVYHGAMIFAPIYLLRSGEYKITMQKLIPAFIVTFIFMASAMIVNAIFDKDFMLLNYGNGSPFQFIHNTSPILYTISMILLGFLAVTIFHGITYLIVRNKQK